jgi:hypothetical protein
VNDFDESQQTKAKMLPDNQYIFSKIYQPKIRLAWPIEWQGEYIS